MISVYTLIVTILNISCNILNTYLRLCDVCRCAFGAFAFYYVMIIRICHRGVITQYFAVLDTCYKNCMGRGFGCTYQLAKQISTAIRAYW